MRTPFFSLLLAAAGVLSAQQAQVGSFANLRPGASTKAEVDLTLGDPLRQIENRVYEYAPPRTTTDAQRIVVSFSDTRQVSRLDVYLKFPLDPELLRSQFGTKVMAREGTAGSLEEFYYPKLNAVVLSGKSQPAQAIAIAYLSPRLVADLFADRAETMRAQKNYLEAQTEADKAVLVDPDYARGYVAQGQCWLDLKNEDEAAVSFLAGAKAKHNPRYRAMAHAEVGSLYGRRNWPDKADAEFQQAVALAPEDYEVHLRYGQFLRAQKQADRALAEFTTAARLNDNSIDAHIELGALLFGRSQFGPALPHYAAASAWAENPRSAATTDTAKAEWHYRYGVCLGRERKHAEAIEAFKKAVQRHPEMIAAWYEMGNEHLAAKEFDKALESYRSGLRVGPQDFALNQALGTALLESGAAEPARRQAETALRLRPDDAAQRLNVARCWAALGKKKEALRMVEQAVSAGFKDRAQLTGDRHLAALQKDGQFKKILQQMP